MGKKNVTLEPEIYRAWVNCPSTLQSDHKLHGRHGLVVDYGVEWDDLCVYMYFADGDTLSTRIFRSSIAPVDRPVKYGLMLYNEKLKREKELKTKPLKVRKERKMTKNRAQERLQELRDSGASRSKVCTFINDLASSKLLSNSSADKYADILAAARGNEGPVLRMLETALA